MPAHPVTVDFYFWLAKKWPATHEEKVSGVSEGHVAAFCGRQPGCRTVTPGVMDRRSVSVRNTRAFLKDGDFFFPMASDHRLV